ncbi:proton-coupled zinc antiporter SLC30A1 [Chaetodon trifascialis]|uniref:proton-coupled zinc antiporter SLC30A1 n=1 Tax=Chaetodon trifascialis TaxID=109706 RepID=UPI0039945222
MRVLHWCMLGVTTLLLVCEVTISQLCSSLIILVDGFHTLFILMRMALTPSQTACTMKPPLSCLDSPASPPQTSSSSPALPATLPVESSIKPLPGTQTSTALDCGLSYISCRIHSVGAFISALLLASLCLAYILEIVGFFMEPKLVRRPLLPVVVSAVSLLYKMLVLWLNWDQQQALDSKSHTEVNHKEEAKGQAAVDDSLRNGALVLCNPGISSIPDTDSQTSKHQAEVLHEAAPRDSKDYDVTSSVADLSLSKDIHKDSSSIGHLDSQNASNTSPVCKSPDFIETPVSASQWLICRRLFILVIQGLCTTLLALVNSLVMLLMGPRCLHGSGPCSLLIYLDPCVSLLAVTVLSATAVPQVHRYGLMLLQAPPPHISVSDLQRRIASIPGVQAVHDLHVWQLTESLIVASVHVHCHVGFPAHRCGDLMSEVTKVLQSVGVSCCTIQPEFASCSGSSAGSGGEASPVVHREDPSLPPLLACSLACGKACTGSMCCSPPEEEITSLLAPPAGESKEEPQTLVIENTFL